MLRVLSKLVVSKVN